MATAQKPKAKNQKIKNYKLQTLLHRNQLHKLQTSLVPWGPIRPMSHAWMPIRIRALGPGLLERDVLQPALQEDDLLDVGVRDDLVRHGDRTGLVPLQHRLVVRVGLAVQQEFPDARPDGVPRTAGDRSVDVREGVRARRGEFFLLEGGHRWSCRLGIKMKK